MKQAVLEMLPTASINLDKDNPRIKHYLEQYKEIKSEMIALALSDSSNESASTTYHALRDSIKESRGIIHPIVVNHEGDGTYTVIEGNTRLQIYREFESANVPGDWSQIIALVYDQLSDEDKHKIRLQSHLVGPREWDPYSKAKYLHQLSEIEGRNLNAIISMCGGNGSDIKKSIDAYKYMIQYYKPYAASKGLTFDVTQYSKFKEHENSKIKRAIQRRDFEENQFAKWVADGNVNKAQGVRSLPKIMSNDDALNAFLKGCIDDAEKVLHAAELASADLSEYPYEVLATALHKRFMNFSITEIQNLANNEEYNDKLWVLETLKAKLDFILKMVKDQEQ
ncbi:MAG: ParB N-terminal domain-containing protein [Paludibacteraceae bacterium]|nr:ParB N-terminal domain-containing protein [Paludibacteraceae bacterium]